MKKKEFIQIKGLDLKELLIKFNHLRKDLANLVMDKNMKKLKDVRALSKKKKEIAQILTLIKQKTLLAVLEAQIERTKGDKK